MHQRNIHNKEYNFVELSKTYSALQAFIFKNEYSTLSIDFSNQNAVLALNKAILIHHYKLTDWHIPNGYLCPPIPSRADYLHHLKDLLDIKNSNVKGLDVGMGANCIYPLLAAQIYDWDMTGSDIDVVSVESARQNVKINQLTNKIDIRHQDNNAHIFTSIIKADEYYDFTMCNPPFHGSMQEATKGTIRKLKNLGNPRPMELNFGGMSNELWCNGGETLFLKRMIKESATFANQVGIFTSLVSKKENLSKLKKLIKKLNGEYKIIPMQHGNKQSRILVWKY